jgi:hypothetical protein
VDFDFRKNDVYFTYTRQLVTSKSNQSFKFGRGKTRRRPILISYNTVPILEFRGIIMKNISAVATSLITGLFFSSSAIAEVAAKPAEWLFVHTAETVEMTSATTLVMPVSRDIFAFTDRPNRKHVYMEAHQFVKLWDEGEGDTFKADPPNAVITWVNSDEELKEAEVLITDAIVLLHGGSAAVQYSVMVEAGDELRIDDANRISLFIDDADSSNVSELTAA